MQLKSITNLATIALTLTLSAALAAGCAHTNTGKTDNTTKATKSRDRVSPTVPQLVAHENLHRLEALSHMTSQAAELRVCVAPNGTATAVEIKSGSGSSWFDRAAVSELMNSSYQPFAAPAEIRVCGPVQIVFD